MATPFSTHNQRSALASQQHDEATSAEASATPARRVFAPRLLFKITLPYLALALLLALATIYVVARMQATSVASAFSSQINDARTRVADSIVRTEQQQLADVRTLARLTGLAEALRRGNSSVLREMLAPYAVSQDIERIAVVDTRRRVLAAVQAHGSSAPTFAISPQVADWPFVLNVLQGLSDPQGDKFVALMRDGEGAVLYTASPVYDGDTLVGALVAGTSASTLVERWRAATLADITLYAASGTPLATSFGADLPAPLGNSKPSAAVQRSLTLGSRDYTEVLAPLVLRRSATADFLGVAISASGQAELVQQAQLLLLGIFAAGLVAVMLLGMGLSSRITRPITVLVRAAEGVAAGDLDHELPVTTGDEIGALTNSFNAMIGGLRERARIHDLLGRFVSPTVAQLVLSRPLDLSGESKTLSILFTDLRDFTQLAEQQDPAVVISGLNAYFQIVVEAADRFGGSVNKFGGDSTLVLFGLTDPNNDAQISATAAVQAALAIRDGMAALNKERTAQQLPHLSAGIGINTGTVVVGLIGTERRMEYTAIGDAVNLSSRIQALTRVIDSDILISEDTYAATGTLNGLYLREYGPQQIKGKSQAIRVFGISRLEHHDAA